jgi:hypothetical protein
MGKTSEYNKNTFNTTLNFNDIHSFETRQIRDDSSQKK